MSSEDEDSPEKLRARVIELESLVTHLQHELEQLNAVVIAQHELLDSLRRDQRGLEARIEQCEGEELRDPQSEKPPHY